MKLMKRILPLLLLLVCMLGCHRSQQADLKNAIVQADTNPDSVMRALDALNRRHFSKEEDALYALAYSVAQDKSGLDVNEDTLLRVAYNYYVKHSNDSLYGKCMYYMAKFYKLKDSTECAMRCYQEAIEKSAEVRDTANECLALESVAYLLVTQDVNASLMNAQKAFSLYAQYSKATPRNYVCYAFTLSNCYDVCQSKEKALHYAHVALDKALSTNDTTLWADAYKSMAKSCVDLEREKEALYYIHQSFKYTRQPQVSQYVCLANCYYSNGMYDKCVQLLDTLRVYSPRERFISYYFRFSSEVALGNKDRAKRLADSAIETMTQLYVKAAKDKVSYYEKIVKTGRQRAQAQAETMWYKVVLVSVICLFVALAICVFFIHRERSLKRRVAYQELTKEKDFLEQQRKRDVANQEVIDRMIRNFLNKKIEILEKLKTIEEDDMSSHIILRETEWADIEDYLNITSNYFVERLRKAYPNLKEKDIHFLMLLRINVSQKCLSNIYGISEKSVKQKLYLFKNTIGLDSKDGISLREHIRSF